MTPQERADIPTAAAIIAALAEQGYTVTRKFEFESLADEREHMASLGDPDLLVTRSDAPDHTVLTVTTHHPEDYELVNHEDGTRWRGTADGRWVAVSSDAPDLRAAVETLRAYTSGGLTSTGEARRAVAIIDAHRCIPDEATLDPQLLTDAVNNVRRKQGNIEHAGFVYGETGALIAAEYARLREAKP